MSWDFSTEPEFQEKLDWMDRFVREEIEPFDVLDVYAYTQPTGAFKRLVDQFEAGGSGSASCGHATWIPTWGARATAS